MASTCDTRQVSGLTIRITNSSKPVDDDKKVMPSQEIEGVCAPESPSMDERWGYYVGVERGGNWCKSPGGYGWG